MTKQTNEKVSFAKVFHRGVYTFTLLPLLTFAFLILCLFKTKARRTLFIHLQEAWKWGQITQKIISSCSTKKLYWFHVSSVGEFLQALPVIAQIKSKNLVSKEPIFVFMTYFSPSLQFYLNSKKQSLAHYHIDALAVYPWDIDFFSSAIFKKIKPTALLFTKFDLWPNLIFNASKFGIPIYWISATLSPQSLRLKSGPARWFFANLVQNMKGIFCVSSGDLNRILSLGSRVENLNIEVCGDTRIDSVIDQKNNLKGNSPSASVLEIIGTIQDFKKRNLGDPVLVCGSFWPKDLATLGLGFCRNQPFYFSFTILVPHEVTEQSIKYFKNELISWNFKLQKDNQKSQLYFSEKLKNHVLLVSQVGLLAELYRFADLAFIGTGPGGVHNTLEPAVWGVPIVCGSNHKNAPEVSELIEHQAAQSFDVPTDFLNFLSRIESDPGALKKMGQKARDYVDSNKGSTEKCVIKILQ